MTQGKSKVLLPFWVFNFNFRFNARTEIEYVTRSDDITYIYMSDWSAYSVLRSNYSKICSHRVQDKYSTIILVVIRSIRWDSSSHEPTHRSTHDHRNPNPDMRQLTKSRSWYLRWQKEKPKPTPPTSPSRDVVVIDTHVPRSRAKRPW